MLACSVFLYLPRVDQIQVHVMFCLVIFLYFRKLELGTQELVSIISLFISGLGLLRGVTDVVGPLMSH